MPHRAAIALLCGLAAPVAALAAPLQAAQDPQADGTQDWMTTPNFPRSDHLPTEARPSLPDGLRLTPGAVSLAALSFLPGGTTDSRAKLDAQMYYNPLTGNQQTVVAAHPGDPIDYANQPTWSRVRHYRPGSRWDLFGFDRHGLHLNAICAHNNTASGCTFAHIYGAFIRLPDEILPGDTVFARLKFPSSPFGWASWWEFEGTQFTPGSGGNPYGSKGYNVPGALIQMEPDWSKCYYEVDNVDQFVDPGVPPGKELNAAAVFHDNGCLRVPQHDVYRANGPTFAYYPNHGFPLAAFAPNGPERVDDAYHDYVVNFRKTGHLVDFIVDGRLVVTQYWEYVPQPYRDAAGHVHPIALHMMLSTQPGPTFNPQFMKHVIPQDGGPISDGPWSLSVQAIKHIRGNVLDVDRLATDGNAIRPYTDPIVTPPPPPGGHAVTFHGQALFLALHDGALSPRDQPFTVSATIAPTRADLRGWHDLLGIWGHEPSASRAFLFALKDGTLELAWQGPDPSHPVTHAVCQVPAGLQAGAFTTVAAQADPRAGLVTFFAERAGVRTMLGQPVAVAPRPVNAAGEGRPFIGKAPDGSGQFYGSMTEAALAIGGRTVLHPVATASGISDETGRSWTLWPPYGTAEFK
jgi:hypothetical protein